MKLLKKMREFIAISIYGILQTITTIIYP